ncbi:hypothetical protein B0T25DRAFT_318486 [Lasiosphaeria hispida]|uniref:BTB domain-containing protein n=1 Tax=Lasiosphaeria hispida TaxID=260671 RepID=A0AAJ0H973_9PEZI|nr:hypothetical protein B0T25DRAFT_318486 [Lasiosphaeria hispida]
MDDPESAADQNDGPPVSSSGLGFDVVDIASDGDVLLDVTFETSKETLKTAKKATKPRPGQQVAPIILKSKFRLAYRVQLSVLKQQSKYFSNLLDDPRFSEARLIAAAFDRLSLRNVTPSEAAAEDLPLVKIQDDDEATLSAGREAVFGDLLRILHGNAPVTKPVTMQYLATLAVLADRFDCTKPVSKSLNASLKFKWLPTQTRLSREEGEPCLTLAAEETLRQKILVSWLLDQPLKMHAATREIIIFGSRKWAEFPDEEVEGCSSIWWNLPDDLEGELQYRRECILNAVASVQGHFLRRYTSRTRQCRLGYDSSASCDSYQLGEMIKFFTSRNLLFLVDFSPGSLNNTVQDYATVEINNLISVLKQVPGYQIDKNHTNCGLRTLMVPIMDFIQAMLLTSAVSISSTDWRRSRDTISWISSEEPGERKEKVFRFTRSMASDQRLRHEGMMVGNRMAVSLFTADRWDWAPEE